MGDFTGYGEPETFKCNRIVKRKQTIERLAKIINLRERMKFMISLDSLSTLCGLD